LPVSEPAALSPEYPSTKKKKPGFKGDCRRACSNHRYYQVENPGRIKSRGLEPVLCLMSSRRNFVDEIIQVTNENAGQLPVDWRKEEGILAGISSGAATWAAIEVAKRLENKGN